MMITAAGLKFWMNGPEPICLRRLRPLPASQVILSFSITILEILLRGQLGRGQCTWWWQAALGNHLGALEVMKDVKSLTSMSCKRSRNENLIDVWRAQNNSRNHWSCLNYDK